MNWLARLKKTENPPSGEPTKPTKAPFVGFVAPVEGVFPENEAFSTGGAADDRVPEAQRSARVREDRRSDQAANFPVVSQAITADLLNDQRAIVGNQHFGASANLQTHSVSQADAARSAQDDEMHAARVDLFTRRGLRIKDAEQLAATIARRPHDFDDRRICLECRHLNGKQCSRAAYAGAGRVVEAIVRLPQRCPAFEGVL